MKMTNPLSQFSRKEILCWLGSLAAITLSFLLSSHDYLPLIASLIGVTALAFVSKGLVLGQAIVIIFAVFYGIVSFYQSYYGEMITYLCMSAPMAVCALISWARNIYGETKEVRVRKVTKKEFVLLFAAGLAVTVAFYFILNALGTANIYLSTFSVLTSFVAAALTFLRSPYYAIGYSANDIVLIALWIASTIKDPSCLPMVVCFVLFLAYDLYGFINWRRMQKRQNQEKKA